jgi:hypothetical protein
MKERGTNGGMQYRRSYSFESSSRYPALPRLPDQERLFSFLRWQKPITLPLFHVQNDGRTSRGWIYPKPSAPIMFIARIHRKVCPAMDELWTCQSDSSQFREHFQMGIFQTVSRNDHYVKHERAVFNST